MQNAESGFATRGFRTLPGLRQDSQLRGVTAFA